MQMTVYVECFSGSAEDRPRLSYSNVMRHSIFLVLARSRRVLLLLCLPAIGRSPYLLCELFSSDVFALCHKFPENHSYFRRCCEHGKCLTRSRESNFQPEFLATPSQPGLWTDAIFCDEMQLI